MIPNKNKQVIKLTCCFLTIVMTNSACASQISVKMKNKQKEALSQAVEIDSNVLFQTHKIAFHDLNNDDKEDAVIMFQSQEHCGSGGCLISVYQQLTDINGKMDYKQVSQSSVSRLPVYVYENTTNGWHDISVNISGGGLPAGIVKLKHDGETYPSNPTSYDNKYIQVIENQSAGHILLNHEP